MPVRQTTPGIYHKVLKGQTLWRIAKTYNVDVSRLVEFNRIPNATKIKTGQLIFIPEATKTKSVSTARPTKPGKAGFVWPVAGKVLSFYGSKQSSAVNKGINIQAARGTDIVASKNGRVSFCDDKLKGFGKIIIVDHEDGYSTVYAYNSRNMVKEGQRVKQNQVIAKVGSTGRANSPSLHFEIRKRHKPQNPFYYLP